MKQQSRGGEAGGLLFCGPHPICPDSTKPVVRDAEIFPEVSAKVLDNFNSYLIIGITGGEFPMKVSMKSRYALRLMLALALHEEENLSVKTVAAMQGIS